MDNFHPALIDHTLRLIFQTQSRFLNCSRILAQQVGQKPSKVGKVYNSIGFVFGLAPLCMASRMPNRNLIPRGGMFILMMSEAR